jgi:AcrR family transcriptional regulator
MGRDGTEARERLLDAAEHLFARRGVRDVPIREINELAGQRNASALHYHFGSREGLLLAVFERQQAAIDADRLPLLLRAEDDGDRTGALVGAILEPLAERLRTTSGRNYLRIIPDVLRLRLDGQLPLPPGLADGFHRLEPALADLGPARRRERLRAMVLAATTLLADRAAGIEDGEPTTLDQQAFVDDLVAMASALLGAPTAPDGGR